MKWLNTKNAKPGVWQTRQASARQWDEREGRECNGMWQQSGSYFNWKEARRGHTLGAAVKVSLAKHLSRKKLKRKSEMEKLNSRWQSQEKKYLNVTRSKQQQPNINDENILNNWTGLRSMRQGAGGRQGVNLPLSSSDSFAAFYFFHISTAMSLVCVRVANQVTPKKKKKKTGRRSPKWRLKEANGKWLVSFCLLTRRALISSFLPVVCVSRAKRKPFGMVVPVWVAISLLCIPCNWELISCVSAAQTYEESLVYK